MLQLSTSNPKHETSATGADAFVPATAAATIDAMFEEACARDATFDGHARGVARLATGVGRTLGLAAPQLEILAFAARVHDLGKALIPGSVMTKAGPLDDDEWRLIRAHPAVGAEILASCAAPLQVVDAVRSHHERWDGAGYPQGIGGRDIPLAGRIIAAADAYCAMVEPRVYRAPRTSASARAEMHAHAGTQFDVDCARALVAVTAG